MMGIADAFAKEDRVEVTFSDFYKLMKESTKAEIVMNAVNCNVPHKYIREMATGRPENIDLKVNMKCKDNGNVDEIADAIHKKFEEHISGDGRDERVDGGAKKAASRDIKLTY